MKIKMFRKFFALLLAVCMLVPTSTAFAVEEISAGGAGEIQPQDNGYYIWKIQGSPVATGIKSGATNLITTSGKATATGETFTFGVDHTLSVTISGTCQVTKSAISAALGVSLTKAVTVSGSRTTRSLKKGESVDVYATEQYQVYEITQVHGYQLHSDFYPDGKVEVVEVWVPTTPAISFVYLP